MKVSVPAAGDAGWVVVVGGGKPRLVAASGGRGGGVFAQGPEGRRLSLSAPLASKFYMK